MSGEPRTLTHSVDIDLRGVTKLKSVTPQPTDQGVINGEATIFRFRVRDGERITLDLGRRQVEVVVNPRAGGGYPVAARDEAAELRAALAEAVALLKESLTPSTDVRSAMSRAKRQRKWFAATRRILAASEGQS